MKYLMFIPQMGDFLSFFRYKWVDALCNEGLVPLVIYVMEIPEMKNFPAVFPERGVPPLFIRGLSVDRG